MIFEKTDPEKFSRINKPLSRYNNLNSFQTRKHNDSQDNIPVSVKQIGKWTTIRTIRKKKKKNSESE